MAVVIPGAGGATREDAASGAKILGGSLRFNSASTHYLSRTPGSAGNRRKFTCSVWVKRTGILASLIDVPLMDAGPDTTNFGISGTGALGASYDGRFYIRSGGANLCRIPNALFRDPTAWYHFVFTVDTENGTPADRQILYINGVRQENFDGSFTQNTDTAINNTVAHSIGANVGPGSSGYHGNMLLSEYNFIDGSALTPSSFGFTDPLTNTWRPKKYTGEYGTNGFYLPLDDDNAKGTDRSGKGNNWTANNFTGTSTNPDVVPDSPSGISYSTVPTVGIGTTTGLTKPSNYCTWNPLAVTPGACTFANGNLDVTTASVGGNAFGTFAIPTSGKWYWEVVCTTGGNPVIGIAAYSSSTTYGFQNTNAVGYYATGQKYVDAVVSAYGSSYTTQTIGVAADADAGTITFYRDNVSQGSITHAVAGLFPTVSDAASATADTFVANFGQRPFKYTPPTGFLPLCTANLPRPTIVRPDKFMDVVTYTGDGAASGRNISTNVTSPDLVWIKSRSINTGNHFLFDSARGATLVLGSNQTINEYTNNDFGLGTGSFTVGDNGGSDDYNPNKNNSTYVAWCWKAGGKSNTYNINDIGYSTASAAGLTAGTITPTRASVNTKSGFSIVTYTGTGANATISHGLGVAPSFIMMKDRDSGSNGGAVYHASLGNTKYLKLFQTSSGSDGEATDSTVFNNTSPTSSVFSVGTSSRTNANTDQYVAYLWSEVAGFSKFGSYTGNGSTDGPFVFCGFRPRWLMIKRTDSTDNWVIKDSARGTYNPNDPNLYSNLSIAETTASIMYIDFLSNGFKARGNDGSINGSGATYIFAAYAESPTQNLFGGQSSAR